MRDQSFELFWWIPGGTSFNYTTSFPDNVGILVADLIRDGATEIFIKRK